jgi:predicted secreted Zn-dependent protease
VKGLLAKFRIGLGLAALAAAPAAGGPLDGIPDLEIRYYDVSGRTAADIRASLNRLRPADPATGQRVDGYTSWSLRWYIPGSPEGPCRLDRAEVTLALAVGLPRLARTDGVPPDVLQQWRRYVTALEAHEAVHARAAYGGIAAVLEAIHGAECATANDAASAVLEGLRREGDAYDRLTQHGMTEGAHFP